MLKTLLVCIALLMCRSAYGSVGVVADADSAFGTGNLVATLTGSCHSDAYGMFLLWVVTATNADEVTSVAIDNGIGAMSEVTQASLATGETANIQLWAVAAPVTAATAYAATVTVGGATVKVAWFMLITGDAALEIIDTDATINSDASANPSITLSHGGRSAADVIGFHSGIADPSNIAPITGFTSTLTCPEPDLNTEHDFGARVSGCYPSTAATTSDVTAGWTQSSDDALAIAVSVAEVGTSRKRAVIVAE